MKYIIILLFASSSLFAQSTFGVEIRGSQNITFNSSKLNKGTYNHIHGSEISTVIEERNPTSTSYSVGLVYSITPANVFKLHVGHHKNGRIYDMEITGSDQAGIFLGVDLPFRYLQITPSYSHVFSLGKHRIPLDLGFSINYSNDQAAQFQFTVAEYNYDIRTSLGYQYNIFKNIYTGINVVYAFASREYNLNLQENIQGSFIPHQLGLEASIRYDLFSVSRKGGVE